MSSWPECSPGLLRAGFLPRCFLVWGLGFRGCGGGALRRRRTLLRPATRSRGGGGGRRASQLDQLPGQPGFPASGVVAMQDAFGGGAVESAYGFEGDGVAVR